MNRLVKKLKSVLNRASDRFFCKGSITVETALVLPIFLFAVLTYLYIAEAIRFSGNAEEALHQSARQLATYSYAYEHSLGGTEGGNIISSKGLSLTVGKSMVMKHLGNDYADESPVERGSGGISFLRSSVLEGDEIIDLIAAYKVDTPFDIFGIRNFTVMNRARIRAFTGYDNTRRKASDSEDEEETVFITEHGTVYHRNINCQHLKITVRETTKEAVSGERNENGGKYYSCEFCGNRASSGKLYITSEGDRYHTTLACSALKRGIQAVPLSKAGGRRACKTCGGM
ncbi:MAG: pilus assembly protein [Lachnospiraceae bacterium]|nr:pilus assembly protein [Lachnospiraceae bacterium]